MTTFYRDKAVYVGSAELLVEDRAYRLEDLQLVWHERGRRGARAVATLLGRVLLVLAVFGLIAAGGVAMRGIDLSGFDAVTLIGGAVLGVVLAGTVGLFVVDGVITLIERSYQTGGAEHQIWGRLYDHDVLLFATRDRLRFGKVYRALQRAIEHSDA